MESRLGSLGVDFDEIDASWLALAHASVGRPIEQLRGNIGGTKT